MGNKTSETLKLFAASPRAFYFKYLETLSGRVFADTAMNGTWQAGIGSAHHQLTTAPEPVDIVLPLIF